MIEYKTIFKPGQSEIVIEKSKFICQCSKAETEEEANAFISLIRKNNHDASHNVYAYIIGDTMNIQKYSDDKEPSGTAGMPILEVLKKENITNIVVVVTRYFGGVKLGTGGLIRAYAKSVKLCLDNSKITSKKIFIPIELTVDYAYTKKIQHDFLTRNILNANPEFMEEVTFTIFIVPDNIEETMSYYNNLTSGNINYKINDSVLIDFVDDEFIF